MHELMDREKKRKPYFPPSLTQITRQQAIKLVAHRNNCGEEDAVNFLGSLRQQEQRNEETRKEQPNRASNEERKRSA
jgi:hypothetical protein